MELLLIILCITAIAALVYLIKTMISIRQLALTAELRIRHTTERLEASLDGVDVLTANATSLVMELNEKLPEVLQRTDEMLDRTQNELIPALRHANEATEALSEMTHTISVRVSSLDKVFSWLQVANLFKTTGNPKTKLGILGSVVQTAVQIGLPWLKAKQKNANSE